MIELTAEEVTRRICEDRNIPYTPSESRNFECGDSNTRNKIEEIKYQSLLKKIDQGDYESLGLTLIEPDLIQAHSKKNAENAKKSAFVKDPLTLGTTNETK